jgi:aspartate dehydrogenase
MRTPQRIAMIGYGAVSQAVLRHFAALGIEALCVLLRPGGSEKKRAAPPLPLRFVDDANEMLSLKPDLVIECAGQGAVAQYAEKVVSAGADLMTISMGAFADAALLERVKAAAQKTGAQIVIPAGAVGALDLLAAVRDEGIERVVLRSIKPPLAWLGTAGEKAFDLAAVRDAVCLFKGNAREAASTYPMNANVATAVELVADPHAGGNRNEILAEGAFGRFEIRMLGKTRPEAPRTSISAPLSIVRAVLNRGSGIVV